MKRLLPILTSIGLRYSAILIQFALVVLVSHHSSQATAGLYFIIFGWINSTYFLAGFGLPDGLVREISHLASTGRDGEIKPLMRRGSTMFGVLTSLTLTIGVIVALLAGVPAPIALGTAGWWLCYAVNFHCAQCLLALGRPTAGSFFFYPALNISLLFTLFPYLLATHGQPIAHLLVAAIAGAAPMAGIALIALGSALRATANDGSVAASTPNLTGVMALGLKIAIGRVAQTAIYWVPTWFAGALLTPASAAILGLASRLNNAVAAVMAAIRFIVRPQIVAAAAREDWIAITRDARSINTLASSGVLLAFLTYLLVGPYLLNAIFGRAYLEAYLPLAILMLGTLAEAAGGIVDEILKMTGAADFVLRAQLVAVAGEAMVCWAARGHGLLWLAGAQALTLFSLYAAQLAFLRKRRGVLLLPDFTRRPTLAA